MPLFPRVYNEVEGELLLPLEGLEADRADVGALGVVRLLVAGEVVFALEGCITDVTDEPVKQKFYKYLYIKLSKTL